MTDSSSDFFIESLTLPQENPARHRRLCNEWRAAYPCGDPIEQGYLDQAVTALSERRRIQTIRATLRTECVRTAVLGFEREQEDQVASCMGIFNDNCEAGLREVTRTAAGCRWAIKQWEIIERELKTHGTLYGIHMIDFIQLQGFSACIDELCLSDQAYRTWVDGLVCNPNPKQKDINRILDPAIVPKALQDRDVKLWPGDAAESRARLQKIVDRELPRMRELEKTLRLQYEEPARAEAQHVALARLMKQELPLLRAERMYDQSYQQAVTALIKVRKQTAATRRPVVPAEAEAPEGLGAWGLGGGACGSPGDPGREVVSVLPRALRPNPWALRRADEERPRS